MTQDHVLEMDRKQSISREDVAHFAQAIPDRIGKNGQKIRGREAIQLTAGVYCPNDDSHGRLGVHKTGALMCGLCR